MSIEYVDHEALVMLLRASHEYAKANEHRADYWTGMAAYLAGEGLTYRHVVPGNRCAECGELWPCSATVERRRDGIAHRLGVHPELVLRGDQRG
jgi:hypothetical protein